VNDKSPLPAGSPIPGSRMFREYCSWCHEPMRTRAPLSDEKRESAVCTDCEDGCPPLHKGLTPRQRAKLGKTTQ